jgi:ORF6N domain
LNEQVKRNQNRFPEDFMFQLTDQEKTEVVANCDHLSLLKFSTSLPFAFTEHGAIMAASVLNTPQAVNMSVFVVRAFVRLRSFLAAHKELAIRLAELEKKLSTHDEQILSIIEAIKRLMSPALKTKKRPIGFRPGEW